MTRIIYSLAFVALLSACTRSDLPILTDAHDRYIVQEPFQNHVADLASQLDFWKGVSAVTII